MKGREEWKGRHGKKRKKGQRKRMRTVATQHLISDSECQSFLG